MANFERAKPKSSTTASPDSKQTYANISPGAERPYVSLKMDRGSSHIEPLRGLYGRREQISYDTNMAIAMFVMCCFNLPLGLIASILSYYSMKAYDEKDAKKGLNYARTSIIFSLFGIMITTLIVTFVIFIQAKKQSQ